MMMGVNSQNMIDFTCLLSSLFCSVLFVLKEHRNFKKNSIVMHSHIYEPVWFMMIDTNECYILILVYMILALIQGHGNARKEKVQCGLSPQLVNGFGCSLSCYWDLSDEPHIHFISYNQYSVWMTFVFTQGHRVPEMLELVQSFCCKVAWSNPNVRIGWLCRWVDCKEIL